MSHSVLDLAAAASHLHDDHVAFAQRFDELCALARHGDWPGLDDVWDGFVRDVEAHLELEERQLFPRLAKQGRENLVLVDKLVVDHVLIRRLLADIGLQIQRHAIAAATIDGLVALTQKHAAIEDERIQQWAQRELADARARALTHAASRRPLAGSGLVHRSHAPAALWISLAETA